MGLPALSCMTASSPSPENSRRRRVNPLSPTSWFPSTSFAEKSKLRETSYFIGRWAWRQENGLNDPDDEAMPGPSQMGTVL